MNEYLSVKMFGSLQEKRHLSVTLNVKYTHNISLMIDDLVKSRAPMADVNYILLYLPDKMQ